MSADEKVGEAVGVGITVTISLGEMQRQREAKLAGAIARLRSRFYARRGDVRLVLSELDRLRSAAPVFTEADAEFLHDWVQAWNDVCDASGGQKGAVSSKARDLASRIEQSLRGARQEGTG